MRHLEPLLGRRTSLQVENIKPSQTRELDINRQPAPTFSRRHHNPTKASIQVSLDRLPLHHPKFSRRLATRVSDHEPSLLQLHCHRGSIVGSQQLRRMFHPAPASLDAAMHNITGDSIPTIRPPSKNEDLAGCTIADMSTVPLHKRA